MKSAYFRESEWISIKDISDRLDIQTAEAMELIDCLKYNNRKVIKPDKKNINKYKFEFVGVILYKDIVIKCLPKYLTGECSPTEQDKYLKTIMKVFKEYELAKETIDELDFYNKENKARFLSIIVYLLTDYIENGLYFNQKNVYEVNGDGEIDWDKTINETDAFIANGRPYYFDLITYDRVENESDFFTQLHKYIITECSRKLMDAGLDRLLSLPTVEFDVYDHRFFNQSYVIDKIYKELNIEFVGRKQSLLKLMLAFFESYREDIMADIQLYGTMDFDFVWQDVCAFVLDNKYDTKLEHIPELDQTIIKKEYLNKDTPSLKKLVPFPCWIAENNSIIPATSKRHKANNTIQLDLISIFTKDSQKYFVIWDAKYYNLILEETKHLSGNPGVEDIIKQYVYNLVYREFITKHHFDKTYNIFIFPSKENEIRFVGKAEFEIVKNELKSDDILVAKVPAEMMYELYIKRRKINIAEKFQFPI